MGRRCYVLLRRRYDVPIRRRGDAPLRRLGNVPSRRRWVFHLRRTCDVTGTYRETSLRRRHDVLMPGGVVNPLSVTVQNSGKKRLILDLRYVNKHIYKERIKFEDLRLMEQFLNPHEYLFKFDIKQGYHHIDIHKPHQKFLGFS